MLVCTYALMFVSIAVFIMITREAEKLSVVPVGETGLLGKLLIAEDDNVNFICYDIKIGEGLVTLKALKKGYNHIYYCMDGHGIATLGDLVASFRKDVALAFTGHMEPVLNVKSPARFFVTYVEASHPTPERPLVVDLEDILKDERNVNWGRGYSRRFLSKRNGFGVSLHNTIANPGYTNPLCYQHHIEGVYVVRGELTYKWKDEKGEQRSQYYKDGEGTVVLLDKHDAHELVTADCESEALCVFYPPLVGNETHDFSKGASSF